MDTRPPPGLPDDARKTIDIAARRLIRRYRLDPADFGDLVGALTLDLLEHLPQHDAGRGRLTTFVRLVVASKAQRILRDRYRQNRICHVLSESLDLVAGAEADDGGERLLDRMDTEAAAAALGRRDRLVHDDVILRLDVRTVVERLPDHLQACCAAILDGRSVSDLARESGLPRSTFRHRVLAPIRRAFQAAGYGDSRLSPEKSSGNPASWAGNGKEDE